MIRPEGDDGVEVRYGADTDQDGFPDTLVLPDPTALTVVADVDRDGFADLLIRLGPDGVATTIDLAVDPEPWWPTDPGADACYDPLGLDQP